MAQLVGLGQPFGAPGRLINVGAPVGVGQAIATQTQGLSQLGAGIGQFFRKSKQDRLEEADRALLGQALGGDDVTADSLSQAMSGFQSDKFQDIADQLISQQLSRRLDPAARAQREATLEKTRAETKRLGRPEQLSPTQRLAQERLSAFNAAKAIPKGQRTPDQQKTIDDVIRPKGPLVQIGGLPGGFQFLTPEEQKTQAISELKKKVAPKALTPTEQKGVQSTVRSVLIESGLTGGLDVDGELLGKKVPFGLLPGAAVSQERIGQLWEQVMESTGYASRDRGQQRQIDAVFDRQIAVINKGKGIGVLAKQYEWSRSLYNKNHRRSNETIDAFIKRTGL